jgi:hypothetical protein
MPQSTIAFLHSLAMLSAIRGAQQLLTYEAPGTPSPHPERTFETRKGEILARRTGRYQDASLSERLFTTMNRLAYEAGL